MMMMMIIIIIMMIIIIIIIIIEFGIEKCAVLNVRRKRNEWIKERL